MARRSKQKSNRAKRGAKHHQHSYSKIVRLELDANALSGMIAGKDTILPSLPNMQDNFLVQKLSTTKIGELPVDRFGRLLCKDGTSPRESHILALRLALIRVYVAAANVRQYARATQGQLKSAHAALISLTNAVDQLDQVSPPRRRGQSRLRKSEQDDKWSFCLTAGTLCPANQEKQ